MTGWQWLAAGGAAAAALALSSIGRASLTPNPHGGNVTTRQQRQQNLRAALQLLPLTATQVAFMDFAALGESGWNPRAHNGSSSERAAAARGWANMPESSAERIEACGVGDAAMQSGSWGMFQRLAPYAATDALAVFGAAACPFVDPQRMNYAWQICSAIYLAGRLQRYQGFRAAPTVGNLRLGWWGPVALGYLTKHADRLSRYRRQAVEAGYPAELIDRTIEPFPTNVAALYQTLAAAGYATR